MTRPTMFLQLPTTGDDYQDRVLKTLRTVLYTLFIAGMAGGAAAAIFGFWDNLIGILIFQTFTVVTIVMLHRGHTTAPATFVPAAMFAIGTYFLIIHQNGIQSISMGAYFAVLAVAATLQGKRAILVYTGLSIVSVVINTIVAQMGILSGPQASLVSWTNAIEMTIYLVVTGAMMWRLVDNMSASLHKAQTNERKLAVLNVELEQRVAERTAELAQAKEEAEEARDKALEADRLKSQFLASMSHELRTPLNAILNFSQIMSMGVLGPLTDRQEDTLGDVIDSGKHLLSLINDVLDMSKIQSGMLNLFVEEDIDITGIIDTVTTTTTTLLNGKPVKLTVEVDEDLPTITGDRRRIHQVLLNLLSNAAKFTMEGDVILQARHTTDSILIAVSDTGPGISPEDQAIIFEPFLQTDTGVQHANGTGLGLPICKNLVEAHGGQLWVESELNQGATFYVSLPIANDALRQPKKGAPTYA